ncbi:MAG: lytic transglycosylase domain-containing protein [Bryobacteraceae bacterium]|nr:lytic transglycosylase domain-containing protein [Bryobacteraceae bacterium]
MRVLLLALLAGVATAAEYAVLHNNFRIRAERHETDGDIVRLATEAGVIELSASDIVGFEPEEHVPAPTPPAFTEAVPQPPERPAPPADPMELLARAAERHGLPPELLLSVAAVESSYSQDAVSPKGAIGIMQLMPGTAALLDADPTDLHQNVDAGARHLRDLLTKYDGGLYRALAAYNAGAGAVDRYNGIPPYRETQLYVDRVYQRFKKLNQKTSD